MKFITVFAAILSVAFGYQASWTLDQLSQAMQNPATDPALMPYLEQALNQMMESIFNGDQISAVTVTVPAVDLSTWTLPQLSAAIENPSTDPALLPYLEQALNQMMEAIFDQEPVVASPVVVPAMDVSSWTLNDLTAAMEDPNTSPELLPYLEHALNEIMHALFDGNQVESIVVAVPVGLLPVQNPVAPVVPVAPVDAPVETPAVPVSPISPISPVSPPSSPLPPAPSSPLVQIVVNVNSQAIPVAPVVEEAQPEPVNVVDVAPISFNPVDILHPIVAPVAVGGDIVGPIV